MILLDTGYFVALLRPRDALHSRAMAWASALHARAVTTEYVLLETANALSDRQYRLRVKDLIAQLKSDPAYEIISVDEGLFEEGLQLYADRGDKRWSLTDCVSFTVMQRRGLHQALAYDHHFEQAGFEALLRRDPV